MKKLNLLRNVKLAFCLFVALLFASCNGGTSLSPDPGPKSCEITSIGTITLVNDTNAQASLEIFQDGESLGGVMQLGPGGQHSTLTLGASNYTIEWGFGTGLFSQAFTISTCSSQTLLL